MNFLAVGLANGTVRLFNLKSKSVSSLATLEQQVPAHLSAAVRTIFFSPADPIFLTSAGRDGFVKLCGWTAAIHISSDFVTTLFLINIVFVQNVKLPTLLSRTLFVTILVCSIIRMVYLDANIWGAKQGQSQNFGSKEEH